MKRRAFLRTLATLPAGLAAQEGPPVSAPVEKMTAPGWPAINLNHLGFRPASGRKVLVVRDLASPRPASFVLHDYDSRPVFKRPLTGVKSDFGPCLVGEFSDFTQPGMYQIRVGDEVSVPFFIREDVWRRTLPKAVGYYRYQRCGVDVPGVHPVCHLDDTRRRDTGAHVDEVGGWHDAGDLRTWLDVTMLNGIALLNLRRNLPDPRPGDPTSDQLLEEVRFGNRYFLKMQDKDGKVWADVAGGVNGDNSDNHWTDNLAGTADDRYLNPEKRSGTAAIFAALQGLAGQSYAKSDPAYARQCLEAGVRAWQAFERPPESSRDTAWWAIAACELYRVTHEPEYHDRAMRLGRNLLQQQNSTWIGNQKMVRGFWMEGKAPYLSIPDSAIPPLALLELHDTFPDAEDRTSWKDAVGLYLDDYILPMAERNAYRAIPLAVYLGSPTPETHRPLAGDLTYRYFYPTRKGFWWQGANCHFAGHALVLGRASRFTGAQGKTYVDLAYRQLEWIMGANPFGACMMTGEGMRNPYPHSRFVGLIPGGIMNGIAGNQNDEPILDLKYTQDWRTCEYWSPHVAFYLWAVSALEVLG